jgi:rhodanese-related sulfurtransferase
MQQIQPTELAAWLADPGKPKPVLLDVREPWELDICSIPDSLRIPMREVPARAGEIDPQAPVVAICHHGGRSMHVGLFLEKNGFSQIHNLAGGVDAWAKTVDPAMPKY